MAVRCVRHRLPSKLSTVIGEPGHTNPHAAKARPWLRLLWLVLGFRFSVH